jgi:hypothetical protein
LRAVLEAMGFARRLQRGVSPLAFTEEVLEPDHLVYSAAFHKISHATLQTKCNA